jgi:cell division septal protein FtsQ
MNYPTGRKPARKSGRNTARPTTELNSTFDATAGRPLTAMPRSSLSGRNGGAPRQARPRIRFRLRRRLRALPGLIAAYRPGPRTFALLLVLVCGSALYLFGEYDDFYVQQVAVDGNAAVTPEEVEHASGALNYNIFFVQFGLVERRVQSMPAVKTASAWYEWPNIVHVSLIERQPVFGWEFNRRTAWSDDSGQLFNMVDAPTGMLTVRDLDNKDRVRLAPPLVSGVQAIAKAAPGVKRLDYSDSKGLSFTDERGWRIIIGQPDQIGDKLAVLQGLTTYLVSQKIDAEYLDVRLPDRAFYKPK